MKTTAVAFSNVAFIKYWGKADDYLRLPLNGSISMNLSNMHTKTTVDFDLRLKKDDIKINGKSASANTALKIENHLNLLRKLAGINSFARVDSISSFPASTGLSSSASGFAALTLASALALNLNYTEKELSVLARRGSGSACRSIPGGFVEWLKGRDNQSSYSYTVFPENHWDILDVAIVVSSEKKQIPSSVAQKYVLTSPFIKARLNGVDKKTETLKRIIKNRDFTRFGEMVEPECLEFHCIIMTQTPSFIYLYPETLSLMSEIKSWRREGLEVYFTLNTGHNMHLLVRKKDETKLIEKIKKMDMVKKFYINFPAGAAFASKEHLF